MSKADARIQPQRARGSLITLEGGEGTGKSTQLAHILAWLQRAGIEAVGTREPGGSPGAEILRRVLLSGSMASIGPAAEAILFAAARIDHIATTIEPALSAGKFVVCDRYADSTRAYQGARGKLDPRFLRALERVTLGNVRPDLTLIFDLPAAEGLARAAARRGGDESPDRFESEDMQFHESLRAAYLAIAAAEPGRCAVIDASCTEEEVAQAICGIISNRLLAPAVERQAHSG
ncbi:MAG: dTMP kinase [Beijerinckiaceae bacterium]|nr:dTMP kinase [Beijerinckiaceae bacterium]